VLPKELKSNTMKRCIEGKTFDIVKEAEADERTREAKGTQVCKDKAQITFKAESRVRITGPNVGKYKFAKKVINQEQFIPQGRGAPPSPRRFGAV